MMASGDYTYVNDLDDGDLMGTTVRRREHSSSLYGGVTHDIAGESQSQYDFLDGSLTGSYDGEGDGVMTALELEDFVGVDGSNLTSLLSESNSVFDIGAEEANMQTPTPSVTSRSVSGADFDTLPITPKAKQQSEGPRAASASASKPAEPNSTVSARQPNLMINTVSDPKRPSTPYKYFEIFGGASSLAAGHNDAVTFCANPSNGDAHHRSAKNTNNHRSTTAAVPVSCKGVAAVGHTKLSTQHSGTTATGVLARPSRLLAPPPLHPFPAVSQPHNDSEGFSFGIDTFLHGNQLGFGRQPSFKRLTPAVQGESKKPYFFLQFEDGETNTTAAPASDWNAEEFSTWIEALERKGTGLLTSARGGLCATHAGCAIGENFKREVDAFTKNLLGDYDVLAGATAAPAVSSSSVSGVSPSLVGGSGPLNRRRVSGLLCPGDSQPADHDAFLGDVRTLTPPLRSPTLATGQAKQPPRQLSAVSSHSLLFSPTRKTSVTTAMAAGNQLGGEGGGSTGSHTRPNATASASPQPPTQGNATKCRRHVWSTSLGPHKSTPAGAVNGDVVPDPTPATATEIPSGVNFIKATANPTSGKAVQRFYVAARSKTVAAMACMPEPASTDATRACVAGAAKPPTGKATTASGRSESSAGGDARARDSASTSTRTPYPYMDEDLLAGGYMTGPPQLIRSPVERRPDVQPRAQTAMEAHSGKESRGHNGSNTSDAVAPAARDCRSSLVDGQISASPQWPSLHHQKLRLSWHNHTLGGDDRKTTAVSNGVGTMASGSRQKALTTCGRESSQESPTPAWNDPYDHASTSLPSESASAVPRKKQLDSHRNGDNTLGDAGKAFLCLEEGAGEEDLVDRGGTRANVLPLPMFVGRNTRSQKGATANKSTVGCGATSSHPHYTCKNTGASMPTSCVRRSSRGLAEDPVTVEPIALRKDPPVPLQPSSLSCRASFSRTDNEIATVVEHGAAATPPRRRLTEFRHGDYMLPAFLPKFRFYGTTAEDLHLEALKQQDRERLNQQANEERRQRIQAFMSKRKAEKQLEEQQRLLEATPHLETSGTVGSGLNAIKASKRVSKSSPQRDRAVRQSVSAAGFTPKVGITATVSSPHMEVAVPAVSDTLPPSGRSRGSGAVAKTNVRAVVVLTSSSCAEKDGVPVTIKDDGNERRCISGSIAPSTTFLGLLNEAAMGAGELSESGKTLMVQQPQEHTRFFSVDEFLRISDAERPNQVEQPVNTRGGSVVDGVMSSGAVPRRRLSSLTLTEMNRKFLAGVNVALLLASTERAHNASLTAIQEVIEGVLSHMPSKGELFASIALVAGGNTQDLVSDPRRVVRSTFSTSPLFGPTLEDVTYALVTGIGHLSAMVAESYKRFDLATQQQQPSAGLLVISLLLKQLRGSDVLLSSYLITDAGCEGSIYVAVLRKAQHTPFALFHSALGGPTLTTALMSVDADDTATIIPLLNVQHRLASVANKPCHVGSVRRFLELAQQELQNRVEDGKYSKRQNSGSTITKLTSERRRNSVSISSNNSAGDSTGYPPSCSGHRGRKQHPGARAQLRKRLLEQVAMAQSILNDPSGYRPKAGRETSQTRRTRVLTSMTPASTSAAPPLSTVTAPRAQWRSADDCAMPNIDLEAPRRRLPASNSVTTAGTAGLRLHGTGFALVQKNSPSSSVVEEPSTRPTQLSFTPHRSDAPNIDSDAIATEKTLLSPASTLANQQIARFCPLQQNALPLAGRSSASTSVSTAYVRRGSDGVAAPHRTSFMNFEDQGDSTTASVASRPDAGTLKKGDREDAQDLSEFLATTIVAKPLQERCNLADRKVSRRGKPASADNADGSLTRQLCVPPGGVSRGASASRKLLLAAPTLIGPNGPQWPSIAAMNPSDIPIAPCVDSIDSSLVHDASVSARQNSMAHGSGQAPMPMSTKVRTLVMVDPRCCETSNVTYDNTMVIATTDDDFEEYDVDEVREMAPTQELIQADLLTELCKTLLLGGNASILGAESRPMGVCVQVLKSVVHTIFSDMNLEGTHRRGRLSVSVVKVKGESVVDLLRDSGTAQKLVIAISPLFGSCVHGVTYCNITNSATFNTTIDAALQRAASDDNGRDYGFLFCSLIFKLQLEEEGDVLVCSLVATFAGEHVGLYTSVLDRSPLVPRALFHYALGGPSYTIALLGIGSEESRANQMLQVQRRLGEVSNRATHPGSVAKFVAGVRNDLTPNLIAKYESTHDEVEREATKEMIGRLAEMVKDADALLHNFDLHQPKAYLHEDQELGTKPAGTATDKGSDRGSPGMTAPLRGNANSSNDSNLNKASAGNAVVSTASSPTNRSSPKRTLPCITAVNQEDEGVHIQSLVCLEQVLMGAGSVAVHGNSILCTSQGGMRYDSDEVIVCDESHRSLSSKLMDQLVAKLLAGYHTGLLAADSSYSAFTPLMLRCIANSILDAMLGREAGLRVGVTSSMSFEPPTVTGELYVSIALIKDEVTADLLPIDAEATYHRFEMEYTHLYGPRLAGVTSHLVSKPQDFDHFLAVAIDNADPALQSADPGIMVVLLTLTQRVTNPTMDVLVSSLLCTAVFDAVHHYELVLEGDTSEPLELFHSLLRGPCFTVALLGISDEEENPGKLLRALHGITQARNCPAEVNSVSRHIRELQRGIVKLKERMTPLSNEEEKQYILSRIKVAEHLLAEAEELQRKTLSSIAPCPFLPLGGAPNLRT
ncbi:hypothetical protein, conserved [Leishmania tarentolae]|uniref:Uncharacterized protein n=1 Tax=Leishmania tarentolae TaxID=5689 RepID=A0A640KX12_LEITA|nr:hypothetical protein, conserved [Leishmania tarentolae]